MTGRRWLTMVSTRSAFAAVLVGAVVVRLVTWRLLGGPIIRGDGPAYIEWAQRIAAGNFSGFQDYPMHQLYPILIAPTFVTGVPLEPYLFVLHLALSVGTVACLYYASHQFATSWTAIATAAAAAVYPALLFWYPYVLSETPFFVFLSLFLAALARLLSRPRAPGALAAFAIAAALLLIARPVSVAILAPVVVAVTYARLASGVGRRRAETITVAGVLVATLGVIALFSIETPLRQQILRYPTVAQSLWLGTHLSSSSTAEATPVMAESRELNERFAADPTAGWDYKARVSLDFIRDHPATFLSMSARRFASFWMPALFADGWSSAHRLFDIVLSLGLVLGTIFSLYGRRDLNHWTFVAAALALAILTSFSQIDPDGRYRVPAELILLPLAVDGYVRLAIHSAERLMDAASRGSPANVE